MVTGGIASGKSTVGRMFHDLGLSVVDADDVGREVFNSSQVQEWLKTEIGEVEDLRGSVRERMSDPRFRSRLNGLTHPIIFDTLRSSGADVLEIPLLVEAGLVSAFGAVLVCDCPVAVTRERLILRLGSEVSADKMLATQILPDVRKTFGDWIIRTDGDLDSVSQMVKTVAKSLF